MAWGRVRDAVLETTLSQLLADQFRLQARNNAWSNARLSRACVELSPEAFAAPRISFFPSLLQTLQHILFVDRRYLADLTGPGRATVSQAGLPDHAAALGAAQLETDLRLVAFCNDLDAAQLARVVSIDRGDAIDYRDTVSAILSHLFVHQIHHRGQVRAMLSGTSVPPPQLDEFFLSQDAPARDEELRQLGISLPGAQMEASRGL